MGQSLQEKDAYRSTMCDLFADTKSFSAKTMQAINKECLYKVQLKWQ